MGHWYDESGNPCHFQTKKDGGSRATTLRDARKLNLYPSVTEILNIVAKPALTNWLVNQAYLAALTLPQREGESLDDFKKRAEIDAKKEALQAAELGSEIHNDIERLFKGQKPFVHGVSALAVYDFVVDYTGLHDGWIAEQTFASNLGYGGMVDLHHPDGWVIDYKTKDFAEPEKKMAYDENAMQLSAYAHGIGIPNAKKMNIFVSRTHPGVIAHHEWEEDYFPHFRCLLHYWQLSKNYEPDALQGAA